MEIKASDIPQAVWEKLDLFPDSPNVKILHSKTLTDLYEVFFNKRMIRSLECEGDKLNGQLKIYHSNKNLSKLVKLVDGLAVEITEYHKNCRVKSKTFFKDGKKHDQYLEKYKSGRLKVDSFFENDQLEGHFREYFPDGNLQVSCNYSDGQLDGVYQEWYGINKKMTANFKKGKRDGFYILFNSDGSLNKLYYYHEQKRYGFANVQNKVFLYYANQKFFVYYSTLLVVDLALIILVLALIFS